LGADPFIGTWKLNIEKSKFTGSQPKERPPTAVETEGNNLGFGNNVIRLDGTEREEANLVTATKRIDDRVLLTTGKQGGSIVFEALRLVSHFGTREN
jgi:hypothetical protein